jgi:hypothetical protein
MTDLNDTREIHTGSKRDSLYLLVGLLLGMVLGIIYTWMIDPVVYETALPSTLNESDKDSYRLLIAQVYSATGNLERAKLRLGVLEDDNPIYALGAQAQQSVADGNLIEAQALALLASELQQSQTKQDSTQATPIE